MPKYLSGPRLRRAVVALGSSGAHKRFAEFLIIKRALVRTGQSIRDARADQPAAVENRRKREGYVILSTQNADLTGAIDDLMAWNLGPAAIEDNGEFPFLNVFGTAGHDDKGYRLAKYVSNGLAVTVASPPWRKITELEGERPREIRLKDGYVDALTEFLIKRGGSKPRTEDAAVWYFRGQDVSRVVTEDYEASMLGLISAFRHALGLTDAETAALFDPTLSLAEDEGR